MLWKVRSSVFPCAGPERSCSLPGPAILHLLLQVKPHFFQVGHSQSIFHPTARENMLKWTPLCHFHSRIPSTVFYALRLKSKLLTVTCYSQTQLHLQAISQTRNNLPDPGILLTLSPTLASVWQELTYLYMAPPPRNFSW